jgi:hypothetical protein
MASWQLVAQRTDGSSVVTLGQTDRIWFTSGASLGDEILLGDWNSGTHVSDSNDSHHANCGGAGHVNNLKFVSNTEVSINGAAAATLSGSVPTQAQMPLKFIFTDASSVATSSAKFYAFDGTTDANPMPAVEFRAIEKGNTTWSEANGSGQALQLGNQAAATTHNFYIGVSISPLAIGDKVGKIKISLVYV